MFFQLLEKVREILKKEKREDEIYIYKEVKKFEKSLSVVGVDGGVKKMYDGKGAYYVYIVAKISGKLKSCFKMEEVRIEKYKKENYDKDYLSFLEQKILNENTNKDIIFIDGSRKYQKYLKEEIIKKGIFITKRISLMEIKDIKFYRAKIVLKKEGEGSYLCFLETNYPFKFSVFQVESYLSPSFLASALYYSSINLITNDNFKNVVIDMADKLVKAEIRKLKRMQENPIIRKEIGGYLL